MTTDPFFLKHGWININKPKGMSSAKAVSKVKRLLGRVKVGHAGTLDPMACGVLPLAIGEATKLISLVMAEEKTYTFTLKWGVATTTDDAQGQVTKTSPNLPSLPEISALLSRFLGPISQVPPAFSAIKVAGKRAYALARDNAPPVLAPRSVFIKKLQVEAHDPQLGETRFFMECGKGTYVRALARDLALAAGSCGHVMALCRTHVGPFSLSNTILLESMGEIGHNEDAGWFPILAPLDDILAVAVGDQVVERLKHGQEISLATRGLFSESALVVLLQNPKVVCTTRAGAPVAIVAQNQGVLKIVRGFNF